MGADACDEHCIPAPQRLLPERCVEERRVGFAALLVTAPGVVHEQVEAAALAADVLEEPLDVRVDGVVTANRDADAAALAHQLGAVLDRAGATLRRTTAADAAAGDVDGRPSLAEHGCDRTAGTSTRAGDDRDAVTQINAELLRHRWSFSPDVVPPPDRYDLRRSVRRAER